MAGKFEIYKDKRGEHRFRLKASNGECILASEGYKAMSGCKNGIASVQKNAKDDKRYVRKESKNGKFMFNLRAGNNQVIGNQLASIHHFLGLLTQIGACLDRSPEHVAG